MPAPDSTRSRPAASYLIFITALALALGFAGFTQHAWEDYYITFRASKNLATGHGLVFNPGDHLHTFTSPLGVLLPALCSYVTGNQSEQAALWLFRIFSAAAFAGGVTLLFALTRRLGWAAAAAGGLALILMTDAKSLDYTINGMETGFMLAFLVYALWSHFTPGPRQGRHLGLAWAGLMWTRPDSFIYIGLIAGGCWLFNDPDRTGGNRRELLGLYLRAGLLTTALYGPWLLWAAWYYGSPIPHTIMAKGAASGGESGALQRLLHGIWQLPRLIWSRDLTAPEGSFLPSYFMFPEWPVWMRPYGRALATLAAVLWVVPRLRLEARVASFSYFFVISYLAFVPYFPFPWYLPPTTLLAFVALVGAGASLWSTGRPVWRWATGTVGVLCLLAGLVLTVGSARQLRAQQRIIEDGNRRLIGEWLHEHAQPGDSVFMEPLGYIGYFSGLKTYDWPGLSSREVPAAVNLVGNNWGDLILFLAPNWLVLRSGAEQDLSQFAPFLAQAAYEPVREFNQLAEVAQLDVPGRKLLEFDARYTIYHRKIPLRHDDGAIRIASPIGSSYRMINNRHMRMVHAPGYMVVPLPAAARELRITYGYPPDASQGPTPTQGATFLIWLTDGDRRTAIHNHRLEPTQYLQHRGLHDAIIPLPARNNPEHAFLVFETRPVGSNNNNDWTFWSQPEFK